MYVKLLQRLKNIDNLITVKHKSKKAYNWIYKMFKTCIHAEKPSPAYIIMFACNEKNKRLYVYLELG